MFLNHHGGDGPSSQKSMCVATYKILSGHQLDGDHLK